MIDNELIDPFALVMMLMFLKELVHSALYRCDTETMTRYKTNYPIWMFVGYVGSWMFSIVSFMTNLPATLAGYFAAFAWSVIMHPAPKAKK